MAVTNFAALTTEQKTIWSMDMWRQARHISFIDKLIGDDQNSVIQRIDELKKDEKGARAVITLLADLRGDGVAGDRTLEGREESLASFDQVIRVDQLRHANRNKGRIANQKSIVKFREASRSALAFWMGDRIDQLALLTMAGIGYTYTTDGQLRTNVLTGNTALADLEFAADVVAPSAKRRARFNKSSGALEWGGTTATLTATDFITWGMLVNLKAQARQKHIRGVREKGGEESYHAFLNPSAMAQLKLDPDYMANLRNAAPRDTKENPLFAGTTVKVDGIYLHEHFHVPSTRGAASGSKWGSGGTVEGSTLLFCGAQALGMADLGEPTWVEEEFDYDNQMGISTGKIMGFLKPQFSTIYEANTKEDFGVIVVYIAM